jgi:plastocyanin
MQRLDPVGITTQSKNGKIVFVPDPAGLIQTTGVVFFSNETNLQLQITLSGNPFIGVGPNAQSNGIPMPASGPQVLGCSNQAFEPYTLQVSDQLSLIQRVTTVSFEPLLLTPGNWVIWQNNDGQVHQPAPDAGTTWTTNPPGVQPYDWSVIVQFPTAGFYPYHCALHSGETGKIVVADKTVSMQASTSSKPFNSNDLSITSGQSVAWRNTDTQAHQVDPTGGPPWPSPAPGPVNPNDFSTPVKFTEKGTYTYVCKFHPSNKGQIVVK